MAEREGTPEDFARMLGREPELEPKIEPDKTPEQVQAETEPGVIAAFTRPKPWAKALADRLHPPKEEG